MKDLKVSRSSNNSSSRFNRYSIVAMLVIVSIAAIFLKTSSIQFAGRKQEPVSFSQGEGRQMTVQAPRGLIVDRTGQTLAYSERKDQIYLAFAGLDDFELNRQLLELAKLFEQYGVQSEHSLTDYFDLSSASKERLPDGELAFVFKKDLDEIAAWQQNKNLFNLVPSTARVANYLKVKLEPEQFYDYLLYDLFHIESRTARGNLYYTRYEAWQIMQLRYEIYVNNWTFLQGEPVLLADNIPAKMRDVALEQKEKFPGLLTKPSYYRMYTDDSRYFSHILGYVGPISSSEYERLSDFGYQITDITGKAGIEYTAERYLHGDNGRVPYGTWYREGDEFSYVPGQGRIEAKPGATVRLNQDIYTQKVLYASLYDTMLEVRERELGQADSASAVMMDIASGRVLAMGSIPSFQPADFLQLDQDNEAARRAVADLLDSKHKPMLNRCVGETYAPASTFKTVTALAGAMEGVIAPGNDKYECKGKENIGYKNWVCYGEPEHGHGWISLAEGLVYSCNLYFFKLGLDVGIDALSSYAAQLGLGEYSGIDLPGEAKGIRPSPELKAQTRLTPGDQEWYPADTCQTSIGQFDNAYTVTQMVRSIAAIVSNKLVTPHVILDIESADGRLIRPEQKNISQLTFKQQAIDMVTDGMSQLKYYEKSNFTHKNFGDYPINVGAKTGTAEVGLGQDLTANAVFICFAPVENPQVAIACFVEGGGKGDITSNIARDLLDAYYGYEPRPEIQKRLIEMDQDPEKFLLIHEREEYQAEEARKRAGEETEETSPSENGAP